MVRLILTCCALFIFLSSKAQYRFEKERQNSVKHQISLNGSTSTWGLIFKQDGKLKWKTDSLSYQGRSTPAIQLAYDYFFNEKASLGIIGSTQNLGMKVDYLIFENPNQITKRFNDFDIRVKRRYLGLRFHYHLVNDENNDLYVGARFGAVFWKISPSISDTDLDSKLGASFPGAVFPSLALGYKYKFNSKLGLGAELSLGIPQLFAYGIDYRF